MELYLFTLTQIAFGTYLFTKVMNIYQIRHVLKLSFLKDCAGIFDNENILYYDFASFISQNSEEDDNKKYHDFILEMENFTEYAIHFSILNLPFYFIKGNNIFTKFWNIYTNNYRHKATFLLLEFEPSEVYDESLGSIWKHFAPPEKIKEFDELIEKRNYIDNKIKSILKDRESNA